jgi:hypothetical protein
MGYNTSLAIVSADEMVPSTNAREITGYPPGSCISYVSGGGSGGRVVLGRAIAGSGVGTGAPTCSASARLDLGDGDAHDRSEIASIAMRLSL